MYIIIHTLFPQLFFILERAPARALRASGARSPIRAPAAPVGPLCFPNVEFLNITREKIFKILSWMQNLDERFTTRCVREATFISETYKKRNRKQSVSLSHSNSTVEDASGRDTCANWVFYREGPTGAPGAPRALCRPRAPAGPLGPLGPNPLYVFQNKKKSSVI